MIRQGVPQTEEVAASQPANGGTPRRGRGTLVETRPAHTPQRPALPADRYSGSSGANETRATKS